MSLSQLLVVIVGVASAIGISLAGDASMAFRRPRAKQRRLGVDRSARLARARDLVGLHVRWGRLTGRFALGHIGRRLVATEAPRRRSDGVGDVGTRSSVAIIGPTRCGKTAATISAVLDWDGPAILSSVKADLMAATIGWRRRHGDVRVFDPTGSTDESAAGWSPLRGAATIPGAQQATRALIDAGPRGGAENLDFFLRLAEQALWPHLYLAAASGRTMRDVVRWILTQTSPLDPATDLAALIAAARSDPSSTQALEALHGTWALDRRTRASAYATAQTLLGAWTDPNVAAASDDDDIDLAWLLEGNNTLYICAPLHQQQRLAPVFGGLLGDLVNQTYERVNRTNTPIPTTLLVLDEAANTPARWLPHVASTCAGVGILLVTIWQSKTQLDAAYGPLADSVLTNHATKLVFAGVSDLPTLDYVARLVGDEEIVRTAAHLDRRDGRHSLTVSTHQTPLAPAHVLRQARPGHALLIHATLPPAHLTSRPYYANRRLRSRAATLPTAPIDEGQQPHRGQGRDAR